MNANDRGPGVVIPPPLLFVGGFIVAWVLDRWLLFEIDDDGAGRAQVLVGAALLVAGVWFVAWAIVTLVRARTPVIPRRPARQLVRTGPYRFGRNPIYLGLAVGYVGLALLFNRAWPLVLLPVVLAVLLSQVIRREERYLGKKFGDAYADYGRQVRRWL